MAVNLSPVGGVAAQFFDNNGVILTGGKIYTYAAGTTTNQATYTSAAGTTAHTNPIVLDAAGRVPGGEIWLTDGLQYKFVVKTSTEVLIGTYDNIVGINPTSNAENVVYNPPFTGGVATNVEAKLAQYISAADFGAVGNGSFDNATAINAAATAVATLGGGVITFGPGTFIVGATINLPDNVVLQGAGQFATVIKLKNATNANIIQKKAGAVGFGAGLFDLTIDGNDTNNTSGGIYWAGASTGRGPSFTFERVTVTKCSPVASPPSGEIAAILTTGSTWGVARDLDVNQNQDAVGWWHKGSDWQIDNLYLGPNGADYNSGAGTHSMIIQGGAGNLFTSCYFGGNGGLSQVFLWGSQRNLFVNCINDNAWEQAYRFDALTGTGANNNRFLGGQIRGASGKTNLGFPAVLVIDSTGNVFSDVEWSGNAHTSSGNAADYGFEETGTATGNYIVGGNVATAFATGFVSLAAGSTTRVAVVFNYDISTVGTLNAVTQVNVTAPTGAVPSTSVTPGLRVNNGGAISLWASSYGYNYAWTQAIQDDGSNNVKPFNLNPLGGEVTVGASGYALRANTDNLQTLGTAGNRWSVVYAGTGTINTSDAREKQDIADLDAAEKQVAVALKGLVKKFRFKDAVASKGDSARIHVGVLAQEVIAAFQAEKIDPMRYAIVCYDEWADKYEDVYDDEGKPTGEKILVTAAGSRYGVRYEELLAFVIAAM
jgi:hypothetical protein